MPVIRSGGTFNLTRATASFANAAHTDPSSRVLPYVDDNPVLSFDITEPSDTADFSASVIQTATLAATETSDAVAIIGANYHTAALAATETADTVAISATLSSGVTADLAATETADAVAINGTNVTTAALAATETSDTAALNVTNTTTASLAATETADTVAIDASVIGGTLTADLAAIETSDTASFVASVSVPDDGRITGGAGHWPEHKPRYRIHPEYDEKPKKKAKRKSEEDGKQVILKGKPEIHTGVVSVKPAFDALGKLKRTKDEAEAARLAKLRAIALAEDEWLMVA